MKLYEIDQMIEQLWESAYDPETGEILVDTDELSKQLEALEMERQDVLQYVAKLLLNVRSDAAALKAEEKRLAEKRKKLESRDERLVKVLERACKGEKTDLGVATVKYTKTTSTNVTDGAAACKWLLEKGYKDAVKQSDPVVIKDEVKKLIKAGNQVPGCALVESVSCSVR